jgi:hypothetical protein
VQDDVLQVPVSNAGGARLPHSDHPLQLCGRRTLYQLLVCDNTKDTNVGDQQLFPGFMMTEYDGIYLSSRSTFSLLRQRRRAFFRILLQNSLLNCTSDGSSPRRRQMLDDV